MRNIRSTASRVCLAIGMVMSVLAFASPASGQASPEPDLPTAAVAIGDSFVSGEGAGRYKDVVDIDEVPQPDPGYSAHNNNAFFCHRSDYASIEVADLPGIDDRFNISCSGGKAFDIGKNSIDREGGRKVKAQIDQLRDVAKTHDIDLVLIGLGANDVGFTPIARHCIGEFITDAYVGWWQAEVNLIAPHSSTAGACGANDFASSDDFKKGQAALEHSVREILTELAKIDADGEHKIVFQDYVNPMPEDFHNEFKSQNHRNDTRDKFRALGRERYAAGCPIHSASLPHAQAMTEGIGEMMANLHERMLVEFPNADLVYLNVQDAFDGARLCENADSPANVLHTPARARKASGDFVNSFSGMTLREIGKLFGACKIYFQRCQESLHPNKEGHAILGHCLSDTWKSSVRLVDCVRRNGTVSSVLKRPTIEVDVNARYFETLGARGQAVLDMTGHYSARLVNAPGLTVRSVRVTARNSRGARLGTQTNMTGMYAYQLPCGELDLNLHVAVEATLSDGRTITGSGYVNDSISCGGGGSRGDVRRPTENNDEPRTRRNRPVPIA